MADLWEYARVELLDERKVVYLVVLLVTQKVAEKVVTKGSLLVE
jgi:hypothetical protein